MMRDLLGPGTWVGYCTNVHAGATLDQTKANLERYACRVREMVWDWPLWMIRFGALCSW